jgi:hypothetical protein
VDVAPEVLVDAPPLPTPGTDVTLGVRQQAGGGEDQGEGEVRGGLVEHAGRVAHRDAPRRRGCDIDVVEAHGHVADHLEPAGAGVDHSSVDAVRQQAHDRIHAGRRVHQFVGGEGAVVVALHELVAVERVEPAVGKPPRDEDACHRADSSAVEDYATRSMTVALACPPPSHIVWNPRRPPVASSWFSRVVMIRTPLAPRG